MFRSHTAIVASVLVFGLTSCSSNPDADVSSDTAPLDSPAALVSSSTSDSQTSLGACCFGAECVDDAAEGCCQVLTPDRCVAAGGVFVDAGTGCAADTCGFLAALVEDCDGDGLSNDFDLDMDGDFTSNVADLDIDGDGVRDEDDDDVDNDGMPNGEDDDVDNDCIPNGEHARMLRWDM